MRRSILKKQIEELSKQVDVLRGLQGTSPLYASRRAVVDIHKSDDTIESVWYYANPQVAETAAKARMERANNPSWHGNSMDYNYTPVFILGYDIYVEGLCGELELYVSYTAEERVQHCSQSTSS